MQNRRLKESFSVPKWYRVYRLIAQLFYSFQISTGKNGNNKKNR